MGNCFFKHHRNGRSIIRSRELPAELINEIFTSMPFENAFVLLAKMPNGPLARNVQKIINVIKMAMKMNKLNVKNCGPKLTISDDGFEAKHSGPREDYSVRVIWPIPQFNFNNINKPVILFYFEVQILTITNIKDYGSISIGFCCQEFQLEGKYLGKSYSNSIGFFCKGGMKIDGHWKWFKNDSENFLEGDVIGIGIIQKPDSSKKCFATCNGEYLGKARLPENFDNLQLFPAVTLEYGDESIRANFGKEEWQFNEFERVLEFWNY